LIFTTRDDALLLFAVEDLAEPLVRTPWHSIERVDSPKPANLHGPARRVIVVAIRQGTSEYRLPLVLATVIGTTFVSDAVVGKLLSILNSHLHQAS
jgi:hypothetical protein